MNKLRAAFFGNSDQVEGEAFDRELQERKKLERIAAREKAQQDKEKAEEKRRKEAKKLEKRS